MLNLETIKALMRARGLSQNQLSKLCGLSQSGLSTILSGKASPTETSIRAIASALGCDVGELMRDSSENRPRSVTDEEMRVILAMRSNPQVKAAIYAVLTAAGIDVEKETGASA